MLVRFAARGQVSFSNRVLRAEAAPIAALALLLA